VVRFSKTEIDPHSPLTPPTTQGASDMDAAGVDGGAGGGPQAAAKTTIDGNVRRADRTPVRHPTFIA